MITETEIVKIINLGIDCEHTTNEIARQILIEIARSDIRIKAKGGKMMNGRGVRQSNPIFIGKTVKSIEFNDNEFTIFFTDASYIEVSTDDESLGYDIEE